MGPLQRLLADITMSHLLKISILFTLFEINELIYTVEKLKFII